jgi:biotin operon repressor
MIRMHFGAEDLVRARFAISPMWETASAIRALRNPSLVSLHLPWVKQIRPLIRQMDLSPAFALLPRQGYIADFLTPPPSTPLVSFEDELDLVRNTDPEQILHDVDVLVRCGNPSEELELYRKDPRGEVERLAEVLEEFWFRAIEPHWPRVRSLLEADLLYRSRRLTEGGLDNLFADLHPGVRWDGIGTLDLTENECDVDVELDGCGLLLVPAVFSPGRPAAMTEANWQPTVIYPARGIGLLWEAAEPAPDALAKVLGSSRAALLADLDAPRSTTDLAQRLEMTAGGVSQHLGALKDAGLVTAQRNGRSVLYCRSCLADELVGV